MYEYIVLVVCIPFLHQFLSHCYAQLPKTPNNNKQTNKQKQQQQQQKKPKEL